MAVDCEIAFWHPLRWPMGWKRSQYQSASRFSQITVASASSEVSLQLGRMRVKSCEITTNMRLTSARGMPTGARPQDVGVAAYFELNKKPVVLACDRWNTVEDNLWAIGKHIDALRGQERWGVGSIDQAFTGYAALPPADRLGEANAAYLLGLTADETRSPEAINARFRDLAKEMHPDAGGSANQFKMIVQAREELLGALQR